MKHYFYIYLAIMTLTVYAIRVLPLTFLRKPIQNPFLQSFLYYVPYVTLSTMTFPAILSATQTPVAGIAALAVGMIVSWKGAGLFPVSISCCAVVFLVEAILV